MNTYHIIIQQERRTPVVKERRVYLGKYGYKVDVDGCTYMVELEPDNFETVQEEDRSRMAIPISKSIPTGATINDMPEYVAGPVQLHTHTVFSVLEALDNPQFIMVAEWDGVSPYVICHKGDYSARTMGYAGWPDLTKEQYDALATDTPAA